MYKKNEKNYTLTQGQLSKFNCPPLTLSEQINKYYVICYPNLNEYKIHVDLNVSFQSHPTPRPAHQE